MADQAEIDRRLDTIIRLERNKTQLEKLILSERRELEAIVKQVNRRPDDVSFHPRVP